MCQHVSAQLNCNIRKDSVRHNKEMAERLEGGLHTLQSFHWVHSAQHSCDTVIQTARLAHVCTELQSTELCQAKWCFWQDAAYGHNNIDA